MAYICIAYSLQPCIASLIRNAIFRCTRDSLRKGIEDGRLVGGVDEPYDRQFGDFFNMKGYMGSDDHAMHRRMVDDDRWNFANVVHSDLNVMW